MPEHNLLLQIEGDASGARRALAEVATAVSALDKKDATIDVSVEAKQADDRIRRLEKRLRQLDLSEANPQVRMEIADAISQSLALRNELKRLKKEEVDIAGVRELIGNLDALENKTRSVVNTLKGQAGLQDLQKNLDGIRTRLQGIDRTRVSPKAELGIAQAEKSADALEARLKELSDEDVVIDVKTEQQLVGDVGKLDDQTVVLEVLAETSQAEAAVDEVLADFKRIDKKRVSSEMALDISDFIRDAAIVKKTLAELNRQGITDPDIRAGAIAQATEFTARSREFLNSVDHMGREVDRKSEQAGKDFAQNMAAGVAEARTTLESLDQTTITPEAKLRSAQLFIELDAVEARIKELDDEDVVVDVKTRGAISRDVEQIRDRAVTVTVDADLTQMKAKLAEAKAQLARDIEGKVYKAEVQATIDQLFADVAAMEATLDTATRDRTIDIELRQNINRDVDALSGAMRRFGGNADQMSDRVGTLVESFEGGGLGAVRFSRVLKGLTPFIAGIATLIFTALIPAVGAMIASFGAAVGAVGALAAAMIATMGPAVGLLIGLFSRLAAVFGAKQAQDQAAAVGARNAGKAAKQSADAHRQEASAADSVRNAQQSLTAARRGYVEAVREAREAIRDSAENEAEAIERVADAERDLARARRDLRTARDEAGERITDAIKDRTEATEDLQRAQESLAEATVDGYRAMEDAITRVRDAQFGLRDAQLGLEDAQDQVSDLEREIKKLLETAGGSGNALTKLEGIDLRGFDAESFVSGLGLETDLDTAEKLSDKLRDLAHAKLDLDKATANLTDSETDLSRAQQDQTAFATKGINAYGPYANAVRAAADAQDKLGEASVKADELMKLGVARAPSVIDAEERLGDARRALRDATQELTKAQAEHNRLVAQGVSDNPRVIAAAETIRNAQQSIVAANRNAAASFDDIGARAEQSAAVAAKKFAELSLEEQKFLSFIRFAGAGLRGLIQDGSDAILRGFREGIAAILPEIAKAEPVFDALGTIWGNKIRQGLTALKDPDWQAAFAEISRGAASLSDIGANAFGKFLETFRNIATAAVPSLERVSRGVKDFFTDTASGTNNTEKLSNVIEDLTDHLVLWLELTWQLTRAFGGFVAAASGPAKDFVKFLRDGAERLADWANSAEGSERIQQFFEDTLPMVKEFAKLLGQLVIIGLQLFEFFAPFLHDVFEAFNLLLKPIRFFLELMNKLPAPIKSLVAGIALMGPASLGLKGTIKLFKEASGPIQFVTVLLTTFWRTAKNSVGDFIEALAVGGGLFNAMVDVVSDLAGAFVDLVESLVNVSGVFDAIGSAASAVGTAIKDAVGAVGEAIGFIANFIKGAVEKYVALYTGAGHFVIGKIVGGLRTAIEGLVSFGGWLFDRLKNAVERGVTAYVNIGLTVIRAIVGGVRTAVEAVTGFGSWLFDRLSNAVDRSVDAIRGIGGRVIGWIGDGLSTAAGAIANFGDWLADRLRNAAGRAWKRITGIGEAIIHGIGQGMEAAKDWFIEKLKDILPGPIEKILKIGSPSKLARGWGKNVIEGFVQGLEEEKPAVEGAFKGITDGVQISGLSADIGEIDTKSASKALETFSDALGKVGKISEDAGTGITESVAEGIESDPAVVEASAESLVLQLAKGLDDQVRNIELTGNWITATLMQAARTLVTQLATYGVWLFAQLQAVVHAQAPGLGTLGHWVTATLINAARAGLTSIQPFGSTLRDSIDADLKRFDPAFHQMGVHASAEILKGMRERVDTSGEVEDFGRRLVRSVEEFFGIASPSKVFMSLGEHMGEGLMLGLVKKNPMGVIQEQFGGMARFARGLVLHAPDWLPGADFSSFPKMAHLGLELWDQKKMTLGAIPNDLFDAIFDLPSSLLKRYFGGDSKEQIAAVIVAVGKHMKASAEEILAAMAAGLAESGLRNVPPGKGDRDSVGVFQQRPSTGWGSPKELMNPFVSARKFYRALISNRPQRGDVADWAQRVQKSAFSDASNYRAQLGEALRLVRDLGVKLKDAALDIGTQQKGGGIPTGGIKGLLGLGLQMAKEYGLRVTALTGGRHTPGSLHYAGRAADVADGPAAMLRFARALYERFKDTLEELFHNLLGFSIVTRGVRGGPGAGGDHRDHVHFAFAKGGLVKSQVFGEMGEAGREAVLPLNSAVLSALGAEIAAHMKVNIVVPTQLFSQPAVLGRGTGTVLQDVNINMPGHTGGDTNDPSVTAAQLGHALTVRGGVR